MVYFGLFISLCGFHIWAFLLIFMALYFLFLVDSLWSRTGFHFFSFVGGSGVLSHRAYSGDILFFVGSLLQRRIYILISLALHRREVEKGHTFLF